MEAIKFKIEITGEKTLREFCKEMYEFLKSQGKSEEILKEFNELVDTEEEKDLEKALENENHNFWTDVPYFMIDEYLFAYMDEVFEGYGFLRSDDDGLPCNFWRFIKCD